LFVIAQFTQGRLGIEMLVKRFRLTVKLQNHAKCSKHNHKHKYKHKVEGTGILKCYFICRTININTQ